MPGHGHLLSVSLASGVPAAADARSNSVPFTMSPDATDPVDDADRTVDDPRSDSDPDPDPKPDAVFELAADDTARRILSAASEEPMSASQLADRCGVSEPTIYRRVKTLREHGLIEGSLKISSDGDHHEEFETTVDRVCLEFDGGLAVDVQIDRDFVDKFADLWEDLERSGSSFGWRSS